jgi:hypothetical protein
MVENTSGRAGKTSARVGKTSVWVKTLDWVEKPQLL